MCDEDVAALVVDNGSGMCKVRILNKKIDIFTNQNWFFTCDEPNNRRFEISVPLQKGFDLIV